MNILVWNVRGASKPSFFSSFRRIGMIHHPDICILLETRLGGSSLLRVRCRFSEDWGFYAVDSIGLSGGIVVAWDRGAAIIDIFHRCSQQVALVVTEPRGSTWLLSGIYTSTNYRKRRVL